MASAPDPETPKPKHGGSRRKLSWQDKVDLCDADVVRQFLRAGTCGCASGCISKLCALGEAGVDIVKELREERCEGA